MCQITRILEATSLALLIGAFPGLAAAKLKAPAGPVSVDCDAGESINEALQLGLPGEPLVINFTGTCFENVVITLSNVTLQGSGPASSVIVGQAEAFQPLDPIDQGPISVNGASAVTIKALTVEGGETSGISLVNSQVVISHCVIQENGNAGVYVGPGSMAQIDSCTIQDNHRDGVLAISNGSAYVTNSTISGNRHGIQAYGSGFVQVGQHPDGTGGPATITENLRDGIRVGASSEANIYGSIITMNGEYGIQIFGSSNGFAQSNTVDGNVTNASVAGQAGVGVFDSSNIYLDSNQIVNHTYGHGVLATGSSVVNMVGNTVDTNGSGFEFGSGITILRGSTLQMRGGNTITNSDTTGIEVSQNAFMRASGGGGETITNIGFSAFNGSPRVALNAFSAGHIDIRAGSVVTGDITVSVLSTLRMRDNTLTGDVEIGGNSGLGIRNTVTVTGTVSCDPSVFEFSTGGVSRC